VRTVALLREFRKAAKSQGLTFDYLRAGGRHDVYRCGSVTIAIPRHDEIGPKLEFELRVAMEPLLGKRWWR